MSHTVPARWISLSHNPDQTDAQWTQDVLPLCERLWQLAAELSTEREFLGDALADIAAEFSAQWAAVFQKTPEWRTLTERGRRLADHVPFEVMEEALDRESAGVRALEEPAGWSLIVVPLCRSSLHAVLVLAGRSLSDEILPAAVTVGRSLESVWDLVARHTRDVRHLDRLRRTLEITSSFVKERNASRLLEVIAVNATQLVDCDRATIFLWDREHRELVGCPALGVEGGTLRISDEAGVVGQVVQTGRSIRVDEAYDDPRFHPEVDKESGYRTRNLLCVPLLNEDGELVGAFEAVNKTQGGFTADDQETLVQLGIHAAAAIRNTREWEQLVRTREQLAEQVIQGVRLIGKSPALSALRGTVRRLAATDLPVLLLGESGTGKEVVAQALHYQGPRAERPFIPVNCAALTETLLESELFGHEKGAFTDARETRPGKFELADGGTLFLDEIGDMSAGGQAKLLRVLEHKLITRVGGSREIPVNVRVVAATNKHLVQVVEEKRFREDLYYRLSVVTLDLPPLRDRPEDVLPLAEHFLAEFCKQAGRPTLQLTEEARSRLETHSWPGNVRELRNLMERVAFLSPDEEVHADELDFILSPGRGAAAEPSSELRLAEATRQFQQQFIRRAIRRVRGNMSEAARLLGLHRSNLYRKMRQLDMNEADEEA